MQHHSTVAQIEPCERTLSAAKDSGHETPTSCSGGIRNGCRIGVEPRLGKSRHSLPRTNPTAPRLIQPFWTAQLGIQPKLLRQRQPLQSRPRRLPVIQLRLLQLWIRRLWLPNRRAWLSHPLVWSPVTAAPFLGLWLVACEGAVELSHRRSG